MSKQTESEEEIQSPQENQEEEEIPTTPIKQRNTPVLESRLSSQKRKEHEAEMHSSGKKKQHIQRIVFSEEE